MRIDAYQVKCKCGTVRVDGWNEWVAAASSCSYPASFRNVTDSYGRTVTYYQNGDFRCGVCSRYYKVAQIVATLKVDHKCDARCTNAKGFQCECSCGGKNHGAGSSVVVTTSLRAA